MKFDSTTNILFIQSIPTFANNSLFPVILGVTIFELFKRKKMRYRKTINLIGSATFMVYLLHDNVFVYSAWLLEDWITLLCKKTYLFFLMYISWILVLFIIGVICYVIFNKICLFFPEVLLEKN